MYKISPTCLVCRNFDFRIDLGTYVNRPGIHNQSRFFRLSSANQIVAVIPYFFYSKGDQKDSFKRVPITAKLVTNLLKKAGASHVMIMDPHTPQLEGFFDAPVDALKVYVLTKNINIVCSVCSKIRKKVNKYPIK